MSTLDGEGVVLVSSLGETLLTSSGPAGDGDGNEGIRISRGFGTREWRAYTSVTLCAIGETECGKSSLLLSKKGSNFGKTAELAYLWFRGMTGAGLTGRAAVSGTDLVDVTVDFLVCGLVAED